jgi:hypothetical protein
MEVSATAQPYLDKVSPKGRIFWDIVLPDVLDEETDWWSDAPYDIDPDEEVPDLKREWGKLSRSDQENLQLVFRIDHAKTPVCTGQFDEPLADFLRETLPVSAAPAKKPPVQQQTSPYVGCQLLGHDGRYDYLRCQLPQSTAQVGQNTINVIQADDAIFNQFIQQDSD